MTLLDAQARVRAGMGCVHAGFWSGLFHGGDEEGGTLFTRLVEVLNSAGGPARPIFLTGAALAPSRTVAWHTGGPARLAPERRPLQHRAACVPGWSRLGRRDP